MPRKTQPVAPRNVHEIIETAVSTFSWLPADVLVHCAILIDKWALGSIDLSSDPPRLPARAGVEIAGAVVGEVRTPEDAVAAIRLSITGMCGLITCTERREVRGRAIGARRSARRAGSRKSAALMRMVPLACRGSPERLNVDLDRIAMRPDAAPLTLAGVSGYTAPGCPHRKPNA